MKQKTDAHTRNDTIQIGMDAMTEHKKQIEIVIERLENEREKLTKELEHLKTVVSIISNYKTNNHETQIEKITE